MSKVNSKNLTEREFETLFLICKGRCNQEIAEKLDISTHTVKAHIENIYKKFGVHNKVQAAIYAIYHKIIEIDALH